MTRYAIYYTPAPQTQFWQLGCSWLGRDPASTDMRPPPPVEGIAPATMAALTASARRYGFHATLKAPFRLARGFDESHLLAMAQAFARVQQPVALPGMQVREVDDFLALCPVHAVPRLDALAMRCVAYFDALRAPPSAEDLARRRLAPLSTRQEALLQRWGYPHTEEQFRFHMTLANAPAAADAAMAQALRHGASTHFRPVAASAAAAVGAVVDALTIFKEAQPGAPLTILHRFAFTGAGQSDGMPAAGRLFYVVGASGVGKDSLLQWVGQRLLDQPRVRFATRAITRLAHPSEAHEPVAATEFWQEARAGGFSMVWQANGACYAVRRGIEAELLAGCDVVVNGSREYAPRVLESFPDARIVWITAQAHIIGQRLVARRRESGAALLQRVSRATAFAVSEDRNTIHLDNSGPIEVAGARLLALLQD